jgi:chromosomal replication initiator protein
MNMPLPSFRQIVSEVAWYYGLPTGDILGRRRFQSITGPRQVAMYLVRKLRGDTLHHIGDEFHRDHTTVLHAWQVIERDRATDATLQAQLDAIEKKLMPIAA